MKKIALFLADGFEEIEALTVADVTRRAGITCDLISIENEFVRSAHNIIVKADKLFNEEELKEYDMIVFPGGLPGADNLSKDKKVIELVKYFDDKKKYIAAICASPAMVLSSAGIEKNRYITSYPGEDFEKMLKDANYVEELVVVDENIVTSRGPATTLLFAYKIVDLLGENSEILKEGMLWNNLEAQG